MRYKVQGRVIDTPRGLLMLSSADSVEFSAFCQGSVSVKIYAESNRNAGNTDLYFTGYVDGNRCDIRYHITEGDNTLTLCNDIPTGEHTFKIVRQNEWGRGDIYFTDVLLDGKLIAPPPDKEMFIEFIGDSLTTGFGNQPDEPSDIEWGGASVYQDATRAFPYMTAEELDADLSVVAIQGIGTACGGWEFTMNDIYDYYPRVNEKDYSYQPTRYADVVVILLLGNDKYAYEDQGMTLDDVMTKACELCRMARSKHPNSKIIFSPADYFDMAKAKIDELLGGEDNDYYTLLLPMDCEGKGGHPSVKGHLKAKNILVPYIREITERTKK